MELSELETEIAIVNRRSDLDAGTNSGNRSQRNDKAATKAWWNKGVDNKAITGFDGRSKAKAHRTGRTRKECGAIAHFLLSGP